jgi:hypothetical protein
MQALIAQGASLRKAVETLPPADEGQPVSLNSRKRRNAVRVYLEMERAGMGLDEVTE